MNTGSRQETPNTFSQILKVFIFYLLVFFLLKDDVFPLLRSTLVRWLDLTIGCSEVNGGEGDRQTLRELDLLSKSCVFVLLYLHIKVRELLEVSHGWIFILPVTFPEVTGRHVSEDSQKCM